MRVFMFKPEFAELVRLGAKRQTIRRKAHCKPGDTLSLRRWTGEPYRSKHEILCEKKCSYVMPVIITERGIEASNVPTGECWESMPEDYNKLARLDGFSDWESMRDWFRKTHGLPFRGELVSWAT